MAIRYGRAGGNWSAAGTWSASSGGGSDGTGLASGDQVILNAASSGTFTIDSATFNILSLDCTGFTGTLTHAASTVSVSGSGNAFTLVSGMTYNASSSSRIVQFTNTSGTTVNVDCGTKTMGGVIFNGVGGVFSLVRDTTVLAGGILTLTAGHLNANNKNVSMGSFSSTNTNVREITMGSGFWSLTQATGSVWDCTTSTNLTVNRGTATMIFNAAATGLRTFVTGGKIWPAVSITNSASLTPVFAITGAATLKSVTLTPPLSVTFSSGVTLTIEDGFAWSGTGPATPLMLDTNSTNGAAAILQSANPCTINWAGIKSITWTGAGALVATNSLNMRGNTGFTIGPPGVAPSYQLGV